MLRVFYLIEGSRCSTWYRFLEARKIRMKHGLLLIRLLTFVKMSQSESIVFFDGVCNFCNTTINWLLARNIKGNLRFSSLQGNTAKRLLTEDMVNDLSSIVYYRQGKCFVKSTAVLLIMRDVAWYGTLCLPFFLVPRFVRDAIYDWVARNRYRWFGKRDACRVPTLEERSRFLD